MAIVKTSDKATHTVVVSIQEQKENKKPSSYPKIRGLRGRGPTLRYYLLAGMFYHLHCNVNVSNVSPVAQLRSIKKLATLKILLKANGALDKHLTDKYLSIVFSKIRAYDRFSSHKGLNGKSLKVTTALKMIDADRYSV